MKIVTKWLCSMLCTALFTVPALAQHSNEMVTNGMKYIDVPYVAHTLESDEPEALIVNCDEVDCTTFVEYVLAESLSPKTADGDVLESVFADKLMKIRYRNGQINGYPSRLHYIADWVNNGVRNGFLEDVAAEHSPYTQKVNLSYMSSHPQLYKKLANSTENVKRMEVIEKSLNGQKFHYVPENKLPDKGLKWIKDGDIIALTTNISGLDVSHMGIALYVDGRLTLLHASSTDKKVVVSTLSLAQMLKESKNWTGIRVLRMKK